MDRRRTRRELSAENTPFPSLQGGYPRTEESQLGFRGLKAAQEKDYLQSHQGPSRCSASDRKACMLHPEASASTIESLPPLQSAWRVSRTHEGVSRPPATLPSGGGWYLQPVCVCVSCAIRVPRHSNTSHSRRILRPDPGSVSPGEFRTKALTQPPCLPNVMTQH